MKNTNDQDKQNVQNDNNKTALTSPSIAEEFQLKQLIEKEAKLTQAEIENKSFKKELKSIKESRSWRYLSPLRNLNSMMSFMQNRKPSIQQLERELAYTQSQLFHARRLIDDRLLDEHTLKSHELIDWLRTKKLDGSLIEYLEQVAEQKEKHTANYVEALRYGARLFSDEKDDYKKFVYNAVLKGLAAEEIPEFMVRAGLEEEAVSLSPASSFRSSLTMRMRQLQLTGALPEWLLDDKQLAYQFMDALQVRRPWTSNETYRIESLPQQHGMVVKPADGAGSRGVYLIHHINDIIDVKRAEKLTKWDDLLDRMQEDVMMGWVSQNEWFTEELILENTEENRIASDIKFYCFYGKIGLVLEIVRYPETKYCWWAPNGERIRTGKYDENPFAGIGVSEEEVQMAVEISKQIPAPFIRIDFLRSEHGLVFGEFTPKPGNYDEFDKETDMFLGDLFLQAQGRLDEDLLHGKQFEKYKEILLKQ
ncbi:ATP-grasp fold amidoligase family protein [Oceanobacillus manasiensis]|uniref:ATP-grasp fold amidoligase family protein n=1 Tax=Oceanobacillus manasiensis TaxID=586413 RepID=UPI000A9C52F0|nr:ATP-grasp fold amidoligase family protein [Oceanobacillus manasiensis]